MSETSYKDWLFLDLTFWSRCKTNSVNLTIFFKRLEFQSQCESSVTFASYSQVVLKIVAASEPATKSLVSRRSIWILFSNLDRYTESILVSEYSVISSKLQAHRWLQIVHIASENMIRQRLWSISEAKFLIVWVTFVSNSAAHVLGNFITVCVITFHSVSTFSHSAWAVGHVQNRCSDSWVCSHIEQSLLFIQTSYVRLIVIIRRQYKSENLR